MSCMAILGGPRSKQYTKMVVISLLAGSSTSVYQYICKPEKKNPDLGLGGLGAIFIVSFKKRVPQKLRRIILRHFGLVTFRFHSGKTRKRFIFMVVGSPEVSMTPETNCFQLWRHQDTFQKYPKLSTLIFGNYYFGKAQNLGAPICLKWLEKMGL